MTTTLQVRLSAREMARLVDGQAVEIRTNDRSIMVTAPPPDWDDRSNRCPDCGGIYVGECTHDRPASRTYWLGLPVAVTVDDDGTVCYEVDTAEAGVALRKDWQPEADDPRSDAEIERDADAIDADHDRRR